MPRFPFRSIALICAMLLIATTARGEPAQSCGRYLGVGWGDGYHSRTACPPKRHVIHHLPAAFAPPAAAPIPWWKIPAVDAETIPTPAPQLPATTTTFPPTGPSLFREPGEGSSVTVTSAADPAAASR